MASLVPESHDIEAAVQGRLGIITLDRPKALNALNLAMVERIDAALAAWEHDPAVDAVLIRSSSPRAFCADGDVRSIGILPDPDDRRALGRDFFGTEYRLNLRIARFAKPFVALMNGIVMGGGLGISVHGSHRVVSKTVRMAMPETVLGLFRDVGATFFLNRCPGRLGRYLGMIGPHIGAADALAAGLATHHVPFAAFEAVERDLVAAAVLDHAVVDAIIGRHEASAGGGILSPRAATIDRLFASDHLDSVVAAIDAEAGSADWIAEAQATLRRASPTSLRGTWRRLVEGRDQSIERILADDLNMAVRIVGDHDFAEGVRAILVDKDQAPRWDPPRLDQVGEAAIDRLLLPLP